MQTVRSPLARWALALTLALGAAPGCAGGGADGQESPVSLVGEFVGRVQSTQAYIGIATYSDGLAVAYVCDGAVLARWLVGTWRLDGTLDLAPAGGAALADGTVGATAGGTVTIDGVTSPFHAAIPGPGAGFFGAADAVDGQSLRGGWVLLDDGTQRGAVRNKNGVAENPLLGPSNSSVNLASGSQLLVRRIDQWIDPDGQPWTDPDGQP